MRDRDSARDPRPDRTPDAEDELRRIEREIRSHHKADLAGALAGRDEGGHLRGASPTPVVRRALLEVEHWLATHLHDTEGVLLAVILRRLAADPALLEANLERPAATVATWTERLLARPPLVEDLVREVDREWGRRYQERPHFDRPGSPPHPDDPYTIAGVTAELRRIGGHARHG